MNDAEFGSKKHLKLKYKRGDQIMQTLCKLVPPRNSPPPSPLFNLQKFLNTEKSTPESCRMYWNLMNDEEVEYLLNLIKWKYRRGEQIIQTFCKIGSPQELDPPLPSPLICRNLTTVRKVLLNHTECIQS